jgi:hypothetical protein
LIINNQNPVLKYQNKTFCPIEVGNCPNNDQFIEILSVCPGNGARIVDFEIQPDNSAIWMKDVLVNHPQVSTKTELTHCATGSNFYIANKNFSSAPTSIYGTSVARDNSFIDINLKQYGFASIYAQQCAGDAYAYTVIGRSEHDAEYLAYVGYGNRINDYNNRAHSVVTISKASHINANTFGSTDLTRSYTGISVFNVKEKTNSIWIFDMIGPKVHMYFDKDDYKGQDTTQIDILVDSTAGTTVTETKKSITDASFLAFNYNVKF